MNPLISPDDKVGFTGTREGLTTEQEVTVTNLLVVKAKELHHGDCVGADAEAHAIALQQGIAITIHPPDKPGARSFCFGTNFDKYLPEKPFLDRNHDIVDATDVLIACPKQAEEISRSGTWATVRYARKKGKQIIIVYPSGRKFVEWAK